MELSKEEYILEIEKRRRIGFLNKEPITKEGKTYCPYCGGELRRTPEVELSYIPWYHYYCSQCVYTWNQASKEPLAGTYVEDLPPKEHFMRIAEGNPIYEHFTEEDLKAIKEYCSRTDVPISKNFTDEEIKNMKY